MCIEIHIFFILNEKNNKEVIHTVRFRSNKCIFENEILGIIPLEEQFGSIAK